MGTLTIECQQQAAQTSEAISKLAAMLANEQQKQRIVVWLVILVARSQIRERRTIKTFRKFMAACHEQCETGACLTETYERIREVRDGYAEVVNMFKTSHGAPGILRKVMERSLIDWDDLLEDCLIASDPEFRASIARIAKLC